MLFSVFTLAYIFNYYKKSNAANADALWKRNETSILCDSNG